MEEDGASPRGFEASEFGVAGDCGAEEFADGKNDGDEAEEIAQWDERWCVLRVGHVLLCGCVAEADLFLVVEPCAVVRTGGDVDNPLDEAAFDAGFVVVVWVAVGADEPVREMRLRGDDGAPRVDHVFGLLLKERGMFEQDVAVIGGPADGLLEVAEIFVGEWRLGTCGSAEVVAGELCGGAVHRFASVGSMRWMMAR